MKFLSVLALAGAVSAAAVAPRDGDWNSWGCSTVTSTVSTTVYKTSTVTATATVYKTSTVTSTVTAACSSGWNNWGGK